MSETLLQELIDAGTPALLVAKVAAELGRLSGERAGVEAALETRRANDRQRQRDRRARISAETAHNHKDVTVCHVTSRDVTDVTEQGLPLSPPSPNPPQTPQEPQPPLTPTRGETHARTREADLDRLVGDWNAMAGRSGLKTIRSLTADRRAKLGARIAEHGVDACTEAIAAVERSPFCRGDNDRGWQADFDFVLQPKSFNRLIEGSYDRAPANCNRSRPSAGKSDGFANALREIGDRQAFQPDPVFDQRGAGNSALDRIQHG